MQNILLSRYLTTMQMMMYWTSGWYVLESDDGISKKKNQSLHGFANPVRPAHSGIQKDWKFYPIIILLPSILMCYEDKLSVFFQKILSSLTIHHMVQSLALHLIPVK